MKVRDIFRTQPRHDTIKSHLISPHRHDPYKAHRKLNEPAYCPRCGAVFAEGRWQWLEKVPAGAAKHVCPACHRVDDRFPAGEITLSGAFLPEHREEIRALIRNTQSQQNAEHPLSRIIDITEDDDKIIVTTTDIHLPRRIAHALEHAFKGQRNIHYNEEEYFVRASWHRD